MVCEVTGCAFLLSVCLELSASCQSAPNPVIPIACGRYTKPPRSALRRLGGIRNEQRTKYNCPTWQTLSWSCLLVFHVVFDPKDPVMSDLYPSKPVWGWTGVLLWIHHPLTHQFHHHVIHQQTYFISRESVWCSLLLAWAPYATFTHPSGRADN